MVNLKSVPALREYVEWFGKMRRGNVVFFLPPAALQLVSQTTSAWKGQVRYDSRGDWYEFFSRVIKTTIGAPLQFCTSPNFNIHELFEPLVQSCSPGRDRRRWPRRCRCWPTATSLATPYRTIQFTCLLHNLVHRPNITCSRHLSNRKPHILKTTIRDSNGLWWNGSSKSKSSPYFPPIHHKLHLLHTTASRSVSSRILPNTFLR